jgi:hypothetical protein
MGDDLPISDRRKLLFFGFWLVFCRPKPWTTIHSHSEVSPTQVTACTDGSIDPIPAKAESGRTRFENLFLAFSKL